MTGKVRTVGFCLEGREGLLGGGSSQRLQVSGTREDIGVTQTSALVFKLHIYPLHSSV